MNYLINIVWLVIWTTAFMSSFRLIIRLSMTCAALSAPADNGRTPRGSITITTLNLLGTALNWAVIIMFYNS